MCKKRKRIIRIFPLLVNDALLPIGDLRIIRVIIAHKSKERPENATSLAKNVLL
jgi:hypothetical protein